MDSKREAEIVNGIMDTIRPMIKENTELKQKIERLKRDKWISVDDRLPEYAEEVRCSPGLNGEVFICTIVRELFVHDKYGIIEDITHWQPLPVGPEV